MRELAIALLDDEHGISEHAWDVLQMLLEAGDDDFSDIINNVKAVQGRWILPEGWDK
jgi:hypothetical protein